MDEGFVRSIADRLQRERCGLIDELSRWGEPSENLTGDLLPELRNTLRPRLFRGSPKHQKSGSRIDSAT
jgi:hypothetical protein